MRRPLLYLLLWLAASVQAAYLPIGLISVGDTVVIASADAKMEFAEWVEKSNKFTGKAFSSSSPAGWMPFVVGKGAEKDSYTFRTLDGQYLKWTTSGIGLAAKSTSSNHLSWYVTIDNARNALIQSTDDDSLNQNIAWSISYECFKSYKISTLSKGYYSEKGYRHIKLYKDNGGAAPGAIAITSPADPVYTLDSAVVEDTLSFEVSAKDMDTDISMDLEGKGFYLIDTTLTKQGGVCRVAFRPTEAGFYQCQLTASGIDTSKGRVTAKGSLQATVAQQMSLADAHQQPAGRNQVSVLVTVMAVAKNGLVLGDSTGYMYMYKSNHKYIPGQRLIVRDTLSAYNGFNQFGTSAHVTRLDTVEVVLPQPDSLDGLSLTAWLRYPEIKYISYVGTLNVKTGNDDKTYYNVLPNQGTAIGSIINPTQDLSPYNIKIVRVTGFAMYRSGSIFVGTILTHIEEEIPDALPTVLLQPKAQKLWHDGRLLINYNHSLYNLQGAKIY